MEEKRMREELEKLQVSTQERLEKNEVKLKDLDKDETSGRIKLPMGTSRTLSIMEWAADKLGRAGVADQLHLTVWALLNTHNPSVYRIETEDLEAQIMSIGNQIGINDIESYTEAVAEALGVEEEDGDQGNVLESDQDTSTRTSEGS